MKIVLISLLLPAFVASAGEASFEQRCERLMRPSVEVTSIASPVRVLNSISSQMLSSRSAITVSGQALLGVTSSTTRADIDIDGQSLQDVASKRECIAPRLTVTLSYPVFDVFVAREFHPASCPYREIYAHEMRHVQLYREHLHHLQEQVRRELVMRLAGPWFSPLGQGFDLLQRQVIDWLGPLIKRESDAIEVLQLKLDDREHASILSHVCMGEVDAAMGSTF